MDEARAIGIQGTPAILVNGHRVTVGSLDEWRDLLQSELAVAR